MIIFAPATALPRVLKSVDLKKIGVKLARVLHTHGGVEIGIRFISIKEIHYLNKVFRRKNRPTDILSFSVREQTSETWPSEALLAAQTKKNAKKTKEKVKNVYWGDLAICAEYAKEEARRRGLPLREELLRLVIHGVLHLAGYDHATEDEELEMFGLQEAALEHVL